MTETPTDPPIPDALASEPTSPGRWLLWLGAALILVAVAGVSAWLAFSPGQSEEEKAAVQAAVTEYVAMYNISFGNVKKYCEIHTRRLPQGAWRVEIARPVVPGSGGSTSPRTSRSIGMGRSITWVRPAAELSKRVLDSDPPEKKSGRRIGFAILAVVAVVAILSYAVGYSLRAISRTTVTSLSPYGTSRVSLVEVSPSWAIDRNFQLRIESMSTGEIRTVFHSPDEGRPIGSERFLWSRDGTTFLLVGRHFYVKDDLRIATGEQAYFLYEIPTGRGWCSADQPAGYPLLTAEILSRVAFPGW